MTTDTDPIENAIARLWIDNGILYIVYKPDTILDLDNARKITADRLLLQRQRVYPIFVDFRGVRYAKRAAREYFAREGSVLMRAVGVFLAFPYNQAIVNFYLEANTPPVPTRSFTDKPSTLNYLKSFT
ncbi:hypothetical protein LS482_08665 [Sinomicrobium kalidii]|uniref:DUF7793 family protein n=1 Tax=Sinomicrobium kalidii TaxID=2900738 RepID=UPI001E28DCB6|nr:hypothetical protein [Sinomicrobium kalidii]UGU17939.1 hypothetical protein LS482_08665 [Sinomicrobium kalidii]